VKSDKSDTGCGMASLATCVPVVSSPGQVCGCPFSPHAHAQPKAGGGMIARLLAMECSAWQPALHHTSYLSAHLGVQASSTLEECSGPVQLPDHLGEWTCVQKALPLTTTQVLVRQHGVHACRTGACSDKLTASLMELVGVCRAQAVVTKGVKGVTLPCPSPAPAE
jgi:hypothetical protein